LNRLRQTRPAIAQFFERTNGVWNERFLLLVGTSWDYCSEIHVKEWTNYCRNPSKSFMFRALAPIYRIKIQSIGLSARLTNDFWRGKKERIALLKSASKINKRSRKQEETISTYCCIMKRASNSDTCPWDNASIWKEKLSSS
jgi:hypothetical protein